MSRIRYQPIGNWTDQVTKERAADPFDSTWTATTLLLRKEVDMLALRGADPDIVIQLDVTPGDIRADGFMRADTRVRSDGVVVSFESKHGPLRYACDTFTAARGKRSSVGWQANVRAIALGLEALRRVSRYGIGQRGEQYTGWAQIGTGTPMGSTRAGWSIENAMAMLGLRGTIDAATVSRARAELARIHHPDRGGSTEQMQQINAAADWLLSNAV